jgi:hypothetical protein
LEIKFASRPYNPPGAAAGYPSNFLGVNLQLIVSISQNTTMVFSSSGNMADGFVFTSGIDYSFGGKTVSLDAPPDYWSELALSILACPLTNSLPVNDALLYLPVDPSEVNEMGTTAFAYMSLRPDAFRRSSVGGDIPVIIERHQFKVWTWIGNSSGELSVIAYVWINANHPH